LATRSIKLWSFYADLEESLGTLESASGVYDRLLELRLATPQIILNYALMLQVPPRETICALKLLSHAKHCHSTRHSGRALIIQQVVKGPVASRKARHGGLCWAQMTHPAGLHHLLLPLTHPQEAQHWEASFRVYEKGVALFKYPHVGPIWAAYLKAFVERYGGTKLERARDLFESALEGEVLQHAWPQTAVALSISGGSRMCPCRVHTGRPSCVCFP
jgi:hypothetical protein